MKLASYKKLVNIVLRFACVDKVNKNKLIECPVRYEYVAGSLIKIAQKTTGIWNEIAEELGEVNGT